MSVLAARIRNMVSRAVLRLTNDDTTMQAVQVETHADVVRDAAERFQNYGFTSSPHAGAEAIALAVGGSTDHTVVIVVDDRRFRMKGMAGGEVAVYDDLGQSVHLTRDGVVFKGAGLPMLFTDTPEVTIDAKLHVTGKVTTDDDAQIAGNTTVGGNVAAMGSITDLAGGEGMSMGNMRDIFNGHTHAENHDTTTSKPDQQMG